jgi:hypothetical protein
MMGADGQGDDGYCWSLVLLLMFILVIKLSITKSKCEDRAQGNLQIWTD